MKIDDTKYYIGETVYFKTEGYSVIGNGLSAYVKETVARGVIKWIQILINKEGTSIEYRIAVTKNGMCAELSVKESDIISRYFSELEVYTSEDLRDELKKRELTGED